MLHKVARNLKGGPELTFQILLNLIVAIVWMLFHNEWNALTFSVGYLIGLFFIFALRRFFPRPFYAIKLWSATKLVWLFVMELVVSTFVVIGQVTRPRLNVRPGIFRVTTKLKSEWEITVLSNLITLTPGSVVMEVDPDNGVLYIHAMDADEFNQGILESKRNFEDAITEVSK